MSAGFQKRFKIDRHPLLPFGPDAGRYDPPPRSPSPLDIPPVLSAPASGEKAKARDILAAIRTLQSLESSKRPPTPEERSSLSRFCGFGPVALFLFPDPITGKYKDGWQPLGEELRDLLTSEEYESGRRSTFCAFYTSPVVMRAMHAGLSRLGVPSDALILEPGCGVMNFAAHAPADHRFIGVELDAISGRIARALHPSHDIRIENFRDSKLPPLDAVIGNVPFADIKLDFKGQRFSLHDFFFAKSVDSLKPGGVLALVTSRYTLDKQNAAIREHLASHADFLGAIRLPSDAFKREGTSVVTDIVFLRKRAPGQEPHHADPEWLESSPLSIDGTDVAVNRYFHDHPEMVLGTWTTKDTLYGEGLSVASNGDLAEQLRAAIRRLPKSVTQTAPEAPRPPPFTPPLLDRHITEGSFFVSDQAICQSVNGQAVPITLGSSVLKANGTMMGKRLAHLIELRDDARRVLQSQNEGWPQAHRDEARRKLNFSYDRFVSAYGPINKTTFGETKDGTTIRRMPNLVKFRDDPDAMLVMALEEYDESTGKATKAPILLKDVVGPTPPITAVASAEEGLLVSLDRKGIVDMAYIARLYGKPEADVIAELGDLIYLDPETKARQTADEYLSGNVREKLKAAEQAGPDYARNAEALRQVQPEDLLPGDIDANLGAPWIPTADVEAFARELFKSEGITIGYLKRDAVWGVEADYAAESSVPATSDYGTPRANGVSLFDQALNMKTPVIYDVVYDGDRETRVVNQEETLAAREKQRLIKEKFKSWIFADPDRTERLVRIYNDSFNNLRPRLFDGSHLDFPGMSRAFELRQHQKDAVWRGMSSGNTLLAHVVGAGKSSCMAATGMKMKQAGLIKKPMYCIPNHMLEQFSREFLQVYPNAKILVATKEDLARDKRKLLTAKIASGDWDGIIVTHSSFERVGMSREYQERFIKEQIKEYEELLKDRASTGRNIIKAIEKQKAAHEERLRELSAEDKKDDGLVFDELGVDCVFIDEVQLHKNLALASKMERVAGIQTGGSERAFDLYMKARYLDEIHPGHGLIGASGTPISNSMVEMYTMQRYFDPKGLQDRGIEHFDAWAATFGEVVDTMEIAPDGKSLKPRSRFAKFINLPELQQMFRAFADVQTAEMLDLPRPRLQGGKPQTVACPMSEEQREIQDRLVARYERLRKEKVDPREDNALAITTDGRKLALDGRMLTGVEDFAAGKINALVGKVFDIWQETASYRGTQMIFCDMGVHPRPFSAYDEITGKLIERGIPREQIASVGDADSDSKKQALFEKVRNGTVRVLLGSTQKMGTGTNVQKRLVALHHLDAPWKPAEVEQRDGRILRQGNANEEVAIYRYVTEGSFDAYMWQALETKARFINQVMTGESAVRSAEDIGGQELSYAEVKAIASGNPAVLTLAEADAEMQRLAVLKKHHADEQYVARRNVRDLPGAIERLETRLAGLEADRATVEADERIVMGGIRRTQAEAMAFLAKRLNEIPDHVTQTRRFPLGTYRGLEFGLLVRPNGATDVFLEGETSRDEMLSRESQGPRAVLNAAGRIADSYGEKVAKTRKDLELARGQLRDYEEKVGKEFPHRAYMDELGQLRDRLKVGLSQTTDEAKAEVADLAEKVKALKASHTIEAAPVRERKAARAGRPVTAKVRHAGNAHGEPDEITPAMQPGPDDAGIAGAASQPIAPAPEYPASITHGPIKFIDKHKGRIVPRKEDQLRLF